MTLLDELRARLGVLSACECVPDRQHAAADAIARLDDRDAKACTRELAGAYEPCQPCSHDHDTSLAADRSAPRPSQPQGCDRRHPEQLPPGERGQGRRSYAGSVRNSTNSSVSATSSNTRRAVS